MKDILIWIFKKKTGLDKQQLSMNFSFYYFLTRSELQAYWYVWINKASTNATN